MQNATDRTGEGSEHPSTENESCNSLSEPVSPSGYNPETMAGECLNSGMVYAIKDQKILPMIVICLVKVDFHLGLRHLCRQGGKNLVFQHKVKNDLLFGCFSKKLLSTAHLVATGPA